MEYNFSELWKTNFYSFYKFKNLIRFASDKESQINFFKYLGAEHSDENGTYRESPQIIVDYLVRENEEAIEMVKNQYIVFLFTRYEFVIQDAVKSLICDDSRRIITLIRAYRDYEEAIKFSIKEFVNYDSKEEYVSVISERLSSKILSGKPTDVIKRIKCLLQFEDIETCILDELMNKRNKIVHEGKIYKIEMDELEVYYKTVENLLTNIAQALKNNKISVIDDGNILLEDT